MVQCALNGGLLHVDHPQIPVTVDTLLGRTGGPAPANPAQVAELVAAEARVS